METIYTTAPIALPDLKRKFTENVEFVIDYDNSKFKGKILITYLSNLDIKCKLQIKDPDQALALLEEYLNIPTLVSVSDLEDLAINVLLEYQGKPNKLNIEVGDFIARNMVALERWTRRVNSLLLYTMYINQQFKPMVEEFPQDLDDGVVGINFVHLIKHELFPILIEGVHPSMITWNRTFFDDYVFAGQNLFTYFAVKENPLFLGLLCGLDEQTSELTIIPAMEAVEQACVPALKEISHVSSV